MRKFVLGFFILAFTGCATMMEGMPGFTHTAALMLRQPMEGVIAQAEHILSQPKEIRYYFEGEPDQIEARRYAFNKEYDVILLFGKSMFLALDSIEPSSDHYPKLQHDFKSIKTESESSLNGYIIVKTGQELELKVLTK